MVEKQIDLSANLQEVHIDGPNGHAGDVEHVGSWTKFLSFFPNLTSEDIDRQLFHESATLKSAPKAFRNKKYGYRLWKEGFVREVWVKPNVPGKHCLFIVRAKVHASMKNANCYIYIHFDQNSAKILHAKCSCKAGQGGCCKIRICSSVRP